MKLWEKYIISTTSTLREAMIRIDYIAEPNADVFVIDEENHLVGSLSDGDIRRSLIKGAEMSDTVVSAMNKQCIFFVGNQPSQEVIQLCKQKSIRFLPLVSEDKKILQIVDVDHIMGIIPVEAIIMAGGKGKRLLPLTAKVPKPLLPIGDKPIIEYNIDRLVKFGVNKIRISINYLGHLLQEYFGNGSSKNIHISYISEDLPMGTVGSIKTVNNWSTDNLLVMNSDLLTDIDYADFYNDFVESDADLAIAATSYNVDIPYAVLETGKGNNVATLSEKPTYTYYSNAGIYLMKRSVLDFIPQGQPYDMTDLIKVLMKNDYKVISYPIRGYWLDIGKINDYEKAQVDIKHLKL